MKIVFIGAHVDDIELTCGGTLSKYRDNEIYIYAFSDCNESNKGFNLIDEFHNSMNVLKPKEYKLYNFPVRTFNKFRQDILEILVNISKTVKPDMVFFHSENDIHQDHNVIYNECRRAFNNTSMLTYNLSKNSTNSIGNYIVKLSKRDLEFKLKLLSCYKSQINKFYFNYESIKAEMIINAMQVGGGYAEKYNAIKLIK